jgi:hypothetical protein
MTGQADKNDVGVSYSVQMVGRDIDTVTAHNTWATIALVQYDITLGTVTAN